MLYILNILNIFCVLFLYSNNYKLVIGLDRMNVAKELNIYVFLGIFLLFTLYKLFIYYKYGMKWTIKDIFTLLPKQIKIWNKVFDVHSTEMSVFHRVICITGLMLDFFVFFGFGFIATKIFFIEADICTTGQVPLHLITKYIWSEPIYLYKIYTEEDKLIFIEHTWGDLNINNLELLEEAGLSKDTENGVIKLSDNIKKKALELDNLKAIKEYLTDYFTQLVSDAVNESWTSYIQSYFKSYIRWDLIALTIVCVPVVLACLHKMDVQGKLQNMFLKKKDPLEVFSDNMKEVLNDDKYELEDILKKKSVEMLDGKIKEVLDDDKLDIIVKKILSDAKLKEMCKDILVSSNMHVSDTLIKKAIKSLISKDVVLLEYINNLSNVVNLHSSVLDKNRRQIHQINTKYNELVENNNKLWEANDILKKELLAQANIVKEFSFVGRLSQTELRALRVELIGLLSYRMKMSGKLNIPIKYSVYDVIMTRMYNDALASVS